MTALEMKYGILTVFIKNLFNSRMDNMFLISLLGKRAESHFWIGLSNRLHLDYFYWTNKAAVTFTHWNRGMPGSEYEEFSFNQQVNMWLTIHNSLCPVSGHLQGCVALTAGAHPGLWDVLPCTNKTKYICKHLAEGAVLTTVPPTHSPPDCAEGWSPLASKHYCVKVRHWKPSSNFICYPIYGWMFANYL